MSDLTPEVIAELQDFIEGCDPCVKVLVPYHQLKALLAAAKRVGAAERRATEIIASALAAGCVEMEVCAGCGKEGCGGCPCGTMKVLHNQRAEQAEAERDRLLEALTPSAETKAAYHGNFSWYELSDYGRGTVGLNVPWTTIKEIMAAIKARALEGRAGG